MEQTRNSGVPVRLRVEGCQAPIAPTVERTAYRVAQEGLTNVVKLGFLLKDTPPRDLIEAVRTVADGNAMLAPSVTRRLISSFAQTVPSQADDARARLGMLTERERDVIIAVAAGLSNAEIAGKLDMAESTVKAHISMSLAKLGMNNRVQTAILVHEAHLT